MLENFRPGVMERLGLGAHHLRRLRPPLVYCAISGFGQSGPLSSNPAYDQIVQGMSGIMSVTGTADSGPLRVGSPIADTVGGLTAAFAIAAALVRAGRTGEGEIIDVSMLDATLGILGWQVSNWLIAGVEPQAMGNENMTAAPSGTLRTRDKPLNIAANKQEQFEALTRIIGRVDPRFRERDARKRNRTALNAEIEAALLARPADEWADLLNEAGVPAGPVLSVPEILAHEHVAGRNLLVELGDIPGTDRPLRVLRSGIRLESGDPAPRRPPPLLGQDTRDVLHTLGYSVEEIEALARDEVVGLPTGITVSA